LFFLFFYNWKLKSTNLRPRIFFTWQLNSTNLWPQQTHRVDCLCCNCVASLNKDFIINPLNLNEFTVWHVSLTYLTLLLGQDLCYKNYKIGINKIVWNEILVQSMLMWRPHWIAFGPSWVKVKVIVTKISKLISSW
jgi:hypothetical protein